MCPHCGGATARAADPVPTAVLPPPVTAAPLLALLDNIRSIHNVGSMFRTADGAGLAHLYLCGTTATPAHPRLAKAALGAQERVAWSYALNAVDTAVALRAQGHPLWALEATPQAVPLADVSLPPDGQAVVLVVGNERAGVDPGILAHCTRVVALPMLGMKRSLNAAVAFGIAVYALRFRAG